MRNFEKDFREWYLKSGLHYDTLTVFDEAKISQFKNLPFSSQWGVRVDFFDEHDILIEIESGWCGEQKEFRWSIRTEKIFRCDTCCTERQESRKAAFEKAKEIYEQLNQ